MLLHLQALADNPGTLPVRVDLRVRNKTGAVIYALEAKPVAGTVHDVRIETRRDPARGVRKWLCWTYQVDRPEDLGDAAAILKGDRGYARVLLNATGKNYYLATLDDYRVMHERAASAGSAEPASPAPTPPPR